MSTQEVITMCSVGPHTVTGSDVTEGAGLVEWTKSQHVPNAH